MTESSVHLSGDEDVVAFINGQEFARVSQVWLRSRLRLSPAQESLQLDAGGPYVELDGELIDDLDLDVILGAGPNDGELVSLEGPGDSGVSGYVRGGWLETVAPDISHDIMWIGLDTNLQAVVDDFILDWAAVWGDIRVVYNRLATGGKSPKLRP